MTLALHTDHADWTLPSDCNIYEAALLKEELTEALATALPLHCHLADVEEIDGAGIQLLLLAERESARQGIALRFIEPSHACIEACQTLGLQSLLGGRP